MCTCVELDVAMVAAREEQEAQGSADGGVGGGKEAAAAVVARARGGWERPSKVGRRREREEMSTYK